MAKKILLKNLLQLAKQRNLDRAEADKEIDADAESAPGPNVARRMRSTLDNQSRKIWLCKSRSTTSKHKLDIEEVREQRLKEESESRELRLKEESERRDALAKSQLEIQTAMMEMMATFLQK